METQQLLIFSDLIQLETNISIFYSILCKKIPVIVTHWTFECFRCTRKVSYKAFFFLFLAEANACHLQNGHACIQGYCNRQHQNRIFLDSSDFLFLNQGSTHEWILLFPTIKCIFLFKSMPLNVTTEDSSGKLQSDCADQVNSDKETADQKKHPTFVRAWSPCIITLTLCITLCFLLWSMPRPT